MPASYAFLCKYSGWSQHPVSAIIDSNNNSNHVYNPQFVLATFFVWFSIISHRHSLMYLQNVISVMSLSSRHKLIVVLISLQKLSIPKQIFEHCKLGDQRNVVRLIHR
jgi:hypothetical protein